MDDPTCSGTCLMKTDLQNTTDKLAFLKDNWPSFGQIESIDESSKQDLSLIHNSGPTRLLRITYAVI